MKWVFEGNELAQLVLDAAAAAQKIPYDEVRNEYTARFVIKGGTVKCEIELVEHAK